MPQDLPVIPADTTSVIIGDELYNSNQSRINQIQAYLNAWNAMNETGKRNYEQIQNDLAKKIQEGEEAKYVYFLLSHEL
jgi:hypothetical protein